MEVPEKLVRLKIFLVFIDEGRVPAEVNVVVADLFKLRQLKVLIIIALAALIIGNVGEGLVDLQAVPVQLGSHDNTFSTVHQSSPQNIFLSLGSDAVVRFFSNQFSSDSVAPTHTLHSLSVRAAPFVAQENALLHFAVNWVVLLLQLGLTVIPFEGSDGWLEILDCGCFYLRSRLGFFFGKRVL